MRVGSIAVVLWAMSLWSANAFACSCGDLEIHPEQLFETSESVFVIEAITDKQVVVTKSFKGAEEGTKLSVIPRDTMCASVISAGFSYLVYSETKPTSHFMTPHLCKTGFYTLGKKPGSLPEDPAAWLRKNRPNIISETRIGEEAAPEEPRPKEARTDEVKPKKMTLKEKKLELEKEPVTSGCSTTQPGSFWAFLLFAIIAVRRQKNLELT